MIPPRIINKNSQGITLHTSRPIWKIDRPSNGEDNLCISHLTLGEDGLVNEAHRYRATLRSQHEPSDGIAVPISVNHHSTTTIIIITDCDGHTSSRGGCDAFGTLRGVNTVCDSETMQLQYHAFHLTMIAMIAR